MGILLAGLTTDGSVLSGFLLAEGLPEDWDDEEDGEWTAPTITNLEYKGPWNQKKIKNPSYPGKWKAHMIANPGPEKTLMIPLWMCTGTCMGRVGDSIWFVMIKPSSKRSPGETMVGLWTLDDLSSEGEWEVLCEFKMRSIWELDGFRDNKLPLTVHKYPILRQQDDGVLYMLLPEPSPRRGGYGGSYASPCGHSLWSWSQLTSVSS